MKKPQTRYLFPLLLIALSGCVHQAPEIPTPLPQDSLIMDTREPTYQGGSLWQATSTGLAEDQKAHRQGDIITIIISEQASASKEATTGTGRSTSISAGMPNLLGLEKTGLRNWADLSQLLNANVDSKYSGSGSTTREENLNASITARVTKVLANGNLAIQGRRNVRVNNEDQIIVLDGVVRPRDISADNTINSVYIADARISYTGKGIISDRQSPGWLMNLLDAIWPF